MDTGHSVVVHVCNDVGKFGAGFAGSVARRWKAAHDAYFKWHRQGKASGFRAGAVQMVFLGPYLEVSNMISMQAVMGESRDSPLCYVALAEALDELGRHAASKGATVHMPRIGSGLAGGDWGRIDRLILAMMVKHEVNVFMYLWDADGDCNRSEGCWDAAALLADAEAEGLKASALAQARASRGVEFFGWDDDIEEHLFSTPEVQHEDSGQWLTFERCEQGAKSTISAYIILCRQGTGGARRGTWQLGGVVGQD